MIVGERYLRIWCLGRKNFFCGRYWCLMGHTVGINRKHWGELENVDVQRVRVRGLG